MPRTSWPLRGYRPSIEVTLRQAADGRPVIRRLLADTGAGSTQARFELILEESDCVVCGGVPAAAAALGGAYAGTFPIYLLRVQIPQLGFDHEVPAVGVRAVPVGFDGIACFRFLNRFSYGNFGDAGQFGIES